MRDLRKWRRIVRLANASDDDRELAARFLGALGTFGIVPSLVGVPVGMDVSVVPSLAQRAREILPELHALLYGLAPGATRAQRQRVGRLLRDHLKHIGSSESRAPDAIVSGRKIRGSILIEERNDPTKNVSKLTVRFEGPYLGPSKRYATREYRDLLDPIVDHLVPDPLDGFKPVSICQLAACRKFFVRSGRGAFCSPGCKWKYHRMSRDERRDYQLKCRARQQAPAAIREWIEKLERRKLAPKRKRRMLAILRHQL